MTLGIQYFEGMRLDKFMFDSYEFANANTQLVLRRSEDGRQIRRIINFKHLDEDVDESGRIVFMVGI